MKMKIFLICYLLVFVAVGIFVGCEKEETPGTPNNSSVAPAWVADFQELDRLCWRFKVEKSGTPSDWTITCVFEKRIPHVSPYQTIIETNPDLSKALSKALSKVRSHLGVDAVIVDSN